MIQVLTAASESQLTAPHRTVQASNGVRQVDAMLRAFTMAEWMHITVTQLVSHPDDPPPCG